MALVVTTLNGAITQNARQMRLTAFTNPSTGPMSPDVMFLVDGEAMRLSDATLSPTVGVTRGDTINTATFAVPHNTLAPVIYGLTSDFVQGLGIYGAPVWSYGVDSTVYNPQVDATIYIDKATAAALVLTDPSADQQNTVTFISRTAAAHTLTYATGFYDNTTTSDVATWPATAGAALTIQAQGGKWRPIATADDGVTIA